MIGSNTTYAAVMTARSTGPIAAIQLFGPETKKIIKKIFQPTNHKPLELTDGNILVGNITDENKTIDQVTIACQSSDNLAINCHGNPLLVAQIMQLLKKHGAKLTTAEKIQTKILIEKKSFNTIQIEAKLNIPKAKTIQGSKLISNQIDTGLTQWLKNVDNTPLEQVTSQATSILENTKIAKPIIYGLTAVITGPPNSGKSTVLNTLAGKQKAIVTNIKGTTRDYVTADCHLGSLFVKLIDTAGLDDRLKTDSEMIETISQQKSFQTLKTADLILLVLDNSQPLQSFNENLIEKIKDKKIITVLNKSDLPSQFDPKILPAPLSNTVLLSARSGSGIETLIEMIKVTCGVSDFDNNRPIAFTERQVQLLKKLTKATSKTKAASIIQELLNGRLSV